jgi:hypothetical protein
MDVLNTKNFTGKANFSALLFLIGISLITSILSTFHLFNSPWFKAYSYVTSILILILMMRPLLLIISEKPQKVFFVFIILLLLIATSPPQIWDELNYGLPLLKHYIDVGYFQYNSNFSIYSLSPTNGEAILINLFSSFGYKAIHFFNILTYLWLGLISYMFFSRLGIKKEIKIFGVILMLSTPSIYIFAPTIKLDNLVTIFFLSSIYLITENPDTKKDAIKNLYLSIILLGFALGVKFTSLYLVPIYFIFFYSYFYKFSHKFIHILILSTAILLLNCFWLIRNFLETGNPIFPIQNPLFTNNEFLYYNLTIFLKELLYGQKNMSFAQSGSLLEFFWKISSQSWSVLFAIFPFIAIAIFYSKKIYGPDIKLFLISGAVLLIELFLFLSWELRHIITINFFIIISFIYYIDRKFIVTKNKKNALNLIGYLITILCFFHLLYYFRAPLKCEFYSPTKNCKIAISPSKQGSAVNFINEKYPSANVATNIAPLFYLETKYLQLSPLNSNLQSLCSSNEVFFLSELLSKEINLIAYWPEENNRLLESFDYDKSKHLSDCYRQIEIKINTLKNEGKIIVVKVLDDVTIYEFNKI